MTALQAGGPRQQCNTPEITYIFKETSRHSAIRLEQKWKVEIIELRLQSQTKAKLWRILMTW